MNKRYISFFEADLFGVGQFCSHIFGPNLPTRFLQVTKHAAERIYYLLILFVPYASLCIIAMTTLDAGTKQFDVVCRCEEEYIGEV